MAPRKEQNQDQIKTPWGTFSYRAVILACLVSMTPLGEALMRKMGGKTQVAELEGIKMESAENKRKIIAIDEKLSTLVSEFQRFRRERPRTASLEGE